MADVPVERSIFAAELAAILAVHGHTVDGLRRAPFTFDKQKVERLEASQHTLAVLPALSHGELMSIVLLLKLRHEERLRLYAAPIALGTQRLLKDYLSPQRAWEIACEVRDAALAWLRDHGSDDDLLRRRSLRGLRGDDASRATGDDLLFAEALAIYDEGVTQAALGIFLGETAAGQAYLEQAIFLLERAQTLLQRLSPQRAENEDVSHWIDIVETALIESRAELG
jgi:hypothetical protein